MLEKPQQKCDGCYVMYSFEIGECDICGTPSVYNEHARSRLAETYQKPFMEAKRTIETLREEGTITQEQTVNLLWYLTQE